jgi:hypothetical protein
VVRLSVTTRPAYALSEGPALPSTNSHSLAARIVLLLLLHFQQ